MASKITFAKDGTITCSGVTKVADNTIKFLKDYRIQCRNYVTGYSGVHFTKTGVIQCKNIVTA